jgi:hypothetical protein
MDINIQELPRCRLCDREPVFKGGDYCSLTCPECSNRASGWTLEICVDRWKWLQSALEEDA